MATNQPLTFTAQESNSTIKLTKVSSPRSVNLKYSVDGGSTWSTFTIGTTYTLESIGDTIQLMATTTNPYGLGESTSRYHEFSMTGKIAASGNIMSLCGNNFATYDIAMTDYGLYHLFNNCTSLTEAPELPATTLA